MFEEIKKQYYYTEEEILKACNKINIYDFDNYKKFHKKDKKLPPIDYINDGFYYDLKHNFNITSLLERNQDECYY